MKIIRDDFKNEEKKLKRHFNEKNNYDKILMHIRSVQTYEELCVHPFSIMYGFERLKYFKDEYYSFNLGKNKGVIRLICKLEHYIDFKRKKGIME